MNSPRAAVLTLLCTTVCACGPQAEQITGTTSGALADAYQAEMSDEVSGVPTTSVSSYFNDDDPKVEVRINNDGAAVAQKLLPQLLWPGQTLSESDYEIAAGFLPSSLSGPLHACHWD